MDTSLDITRALKVSIQRLPRIGSILPDADLQPHNFGLKLRLSMEMIRIENLEAPHGNRYAPARGMCVMMMMMIVHPIGLSQNTPVV